jgi:hypothetical protein
VRQSESARQDIHRPHQFYQNLRGGGLAVQVQKKSNLMPRLRGRKTQSKMKLISLFSGVGGFEIAATQMGWDVLSTCEINDFCRTVLKHHYPNAYHHDDVKTLSIDKLNEEITKRKGSHWRTNDIVLVGGFP